MANEENELVKRVKKRVLTLFGIKEKVDIKEEPEDGNINQPIRLRQFSETELHNLPTIKKGKNRIQDPTHYLMEVSDRQQSVISNISDLGILNPEMDQAREILVSSIISPNDMQTGAISVTCVLEELGEAVQDKLNEFLNEFFNKEVEFGYKLEEWLGECLFETGSKPIMVLPQKNLDTLAAAKDLKDELFETSASVESLDNMWDNMSMDRFIDDTEDVLFDMEALSGLKETDRSKVTKKMTSSMKKNLKNISKDVQISYDATNLAYYASKRKKGVDKMVDEVKDRFIKFGNSFDKVFLADEYDDVSDVEDEKNHPIILEFPSESVIPVTVPGSKSVHLGYFVLIDRWGTPIGSDYYQKYGNGSPESLGQEARMVAYGDMYKNTLFEKLAHKARFEAASTIFGLSLRKMIEKSLEEKEVEGVDITQYNAVATCMFHNLVNKNKVKLVFVPEPLMVYYRFNHRMDGTGKTLVEKMKHLLALRTTLVVSGVMAAIRNARDNKTIELDLSEDDVNIEQTLDITKNLFIKKHLPKFYNDPEMVARNIVANSLSIMPKNVPGQETPMSVTTDRRSAGISEPTTELTERLSEWAAQGYGVPPSSLNMLNENEYSRSVATNNLFFSNRLRKYQRVVQKFNNKFVRLYVQFSSYLQERIRNILKEGETTLNKNEMLRVIKALNVELATPSVSTSKAQYEELRNYIDLVDLLLERMFPNELYGLEDDRESKELLATIRAQVRYTLIKDFIGALGLQGVVNIPTLDEINVTRIQDVQRFVLNLKKGLKDFKKIMDAGEGDAGGGGRGW